MAMAMEQGVASRRTYPQFPAGIETRFAAVRMAAGRGQDAREWLDDPKCPYGSELKRALRAVLLFDETVEALEEAARTGRANVLDALKKGDEGTNLTVPPIFQDGGSGSDEDHADGVLHEIEVTIDSLRNVERSLDADDTDGKLGIIKTKTGLLQKWAELKASVINIKNLAEFQRIVIGVLDEMLDKEQIQTFKDRLRKAI